MKKIRIKSRSISKLILIIIATFFFWLYSQQPSNTNTQESAKKVIKVTRVIDGDTVELNTGERLRYIGMDTPEFDYKNKQHDCFAWEAKQANVKLVLNKKVRLEKDVSDKDKYERLLRYVYVKNKNNKEIMINEYLVRQGFAMLATYPPDVKYVELFKEAQKQAREKNKGFWKECE